MSMTVSIVPPSMISASPTCTSSVACSPMQWQPVSRRVSWAKSSFTSPSLARRAAADDDEVEADTGVRTSEVPAVELAGERHVRGRLPQPLGEERAAVAVEEEGERESPREHVPQPHIRDFDELRRLARAHCRGAPPVV